MSYVDRTATSNPQAKGVFGRLASHASGRRSGDQVCIYVCDRYVVPQLGTKDMRALANGDRLLDARTRDYIHGHLSYRVEIVAAGDEARAQERLIRLEALPNAGRPRINP